MIKPFNFYGRENKIFCHSGVVLEVSERTEINMHTSSRVSTSYDNSINHTHSTSARSTRVRNVYILDNETGQEKVFTIPEWAVDLRKGNDITISYLQSDDLSQSYLVPQKQKNRYIQEYGNCVMRTKIIAVRNKSTNQFSIVSALDSLARVFINSDSNYQIEDIKLFQRYYWHPYLYTIGWFGACFIAYIILLIPLSIFPESINGFLTVIFLIYILFVSIKMRRKLDKQKKVLLNKIVPEFKSELTRILNEV